VVEAGEVAEAAEGGPEAPASVSGADVALPAIADNTVLLVSVKSKDHSSAVSGLLNLLVNQRGMGGVYLTITRPYAFVLSAMDKASIPSENVYFIDCVSQMAGQHKSGLERVVFIENPSSLEEVTMYLDRMLDKVAGDRKFLFLDSLSSLLIYNSDKSVREFAHFLINKVRLMGIASVVLSIEKKEAEDMVNTMVPMCDARVHWDDRMAYAGGSAEPAPGQETEPSPGQDYGVKDGHSYLLLEDEGKVGVEVFSQLYSLGGYSGLCITRDKPEDVEKVLGGAGVRILWLTDTVEASASVIHPNPIDISVLIKDFLKENRKSIILLDGIQYIIQNTNFKTVLAFLSRLKDLVADSDSILLVPVVKISLNDKELGLLESELDVLEP
jgi:archaellum biogenesis ATPase FlaH